MVIVHVSTCDWAAVEAAELLVAADDNGLEQQQHGQQPVDTCQQTTPFVGALALLHDSLFLLLIVAVSLHTPELPPKYFLIKACHLVGKNVYRITSSSMQLLQLVFWEALLLLLGPFATAGGKLYIRVRTTASTGTPCSSDKEEQSTHRMIWIVMNPVDTILEHYFGQKRQCFVNEIFG